MSVEVDRYRYETKLTLVIGAEGMDGALARVRELAKTLEGVPYVYRVDHSIYHIRQGGLHIRRLTDAGRDVLAASVENDERETS